MGLLEQVPGDGAGGGEVILAAEYRHKKSAIRRFFCGSVQRFSLLTPCHFLDNFRTHALHLLCRHGGEDALPGARGGVVLSRTCGTAGFQISEGDERSSPRAWLFVAAAGLMSTAVYRPSSILW